MKKPSRKTLVRKLDTAHSLFIRARDKRCVVCGSKKNLTCGHLFSRVHYSTRWSFVNCHGQCAGCNLVHEYNSYPFTKFFIDKFGQAAWDQLYQEHATPRQYKDWQLAQMIEERKLLLEELTGNGNGR